VIDLCRSVLYSPASRIDRVRKALAAGAADIVVADLEDGTAPDAKPEAREAVAALLRETTTSRTRLAVRINAYPSAAARSDLDALSGRPVGLLVVPKVESASSLSELGALLDAAGVDAPFLAQVETARGLLEAHHTAAHPRVVGLIFGAEDYAASIGAIRSPEGLEVLYARSHIVACAAAAGKPAIDQIWPDYKDTAGLARDARFGASLGYDGKQLIHPDQIGPTHAAFAPSAQEVDRAQRVVTVVDGRMIDRPLVEQARRVLRRAQRT
jgi:citrate lyase subunit beta / citryl-CoA lyase